MGTNVEHSLLAADTFGWSSQLPGTHTPTIQALLLATTLMQVTGPIWTQLSLRHLARTGVRYMSLPGEGPYLESGLVWRSDDATPTLRRFLDVALQPLA